MNRLSQLLAVVAAAALVAPPCALAQMPSAHTHDFPSAKKANSPLIDKVRAATSRFVDVNVAIHEGWVPGTPCVSGPNSGAMGVHYLLLSRLFDGVLNANEPESLIYEPLPNGALRLVGVEFIVDAATWLAHHDSPPMLEGQAFQLVSSPNRYGLPAFFELHVWAWRDNPNGAFVDWNNRVTCEGQ